MSTFDLNHVKSVATASSQYLIVWTGILVWDTLATLPAEVDKIWRARTTLLKVLFLANRYGTLALTILSTITTLSPAAQHACSHIYWAQTVSLIYVILRIVLYTMSFVLIAETGLGSAAFSQVQRKLFSPLGQSLAVLNTGSGNLRSPLPAASTGRCPQPRRMLHHDKVSALIPFAVDIVILVLTCWRSISVTRRIGTPVPILKRIAFDGIRFYLAITATHIVSVIMFFQHDLSLNSVNLPCSVTITSLSASRLVLALHSHPGLAGQSRPRAGLRGTTTKISAAQPDARDPSSEAARASTADDEVSKVSTSTAEDPDPSSVHLCPRPQLLPTTSRTSLSPSTSSRGYCPTPPPTPTRPPLTRQLTRDRLRPKGRRHSVDFAASKILITTEVHVSVAQPEESDEQELRGGRRPPHGGWLCDDEALYGDFYRYSK
ncbi:hypothetical protein JCM10212_001700 [Sporobolomyces blumeae]